MKNNIKGFTLVELSIVLVIIGLVVSVVVVGQSLVHQAKLRSIINEYNQVHTAYQSFKMQYNGLPGDLRNASSYWSMGCRGDGDITQTSNDNECNGNGDKVIGFAIGGGKEAHVAWYHLSRANLFPGDFIPAGIGNSTIGNAAFIGENIPASKYSSNIGMNISAFDNFLPAYDGNSLIFGEELLNFISFGPFLSPAHTMSLDNKMDDGNAMTGIFGGNSGSTCSTVGAYRIDLDNGACMVIIKFF